MDFAAALKKLEKETSTSSSQQQPRSQQRNGRGGGGGDMRGRGNDGPQYRSQDGGGGGGGSGRESSYYGRGSGDGGDRRRGRHDEYEDAHHRDDNDDHRRRNQRPRHNYSGGGGGGGGGGERGRGDYNHRGGGRDSYYPRRDHHASNDDSRNGGDRRSRSGSSGADGSRGNNNNSSHGSSWPLEELRRFGYHVSPIPYHIRCSSNNKNNNKNISNDIDMNKPPANLGTTTRPFHIALLCVCIDSLPFEHVWREWAQTGNAHVSLLVIAKYPDKIVAQAKREEEEEKSSTSDRRNNGNHRRPARFVRDRLLTKPPRIGRGNSYADPEYVTHTPAWGSVQITRAMLELVQEAAVIGTSRDTERGDVRFMSQRYLLPKRMGKGDGRLQVDPNDIPPVDKFIFISETCIPVQTLRECEDALFGDKSLYTASLSGHEETKEPTAAATASEQQPSNSSITPWEVSWVNARHPQTSSGTPRNKYERDQFQDIHAMIPIENRWKADQWHCLSRPHALAVLDLDAHLRPQLQLWNSCFSRINASDEMYFPTALSILGILNTRDFITSTSSTAGNNEASTTANEANAQMHPSKKDAATVAVTASTATNTETPSRAASYTTTATATRTSSIALRPITYTDWSEGMRNPATFSKGMRDFCKIAKLARQQGSLVARKFALVCPSVAAIHDSKDNNNICKKKVVVEQTGQITASEWRNEVERLASDSAAAKAAAATAVAQAVQ
jgi:Core-2/I-Branching enzyme